VRSTRFTAVNSVVALLALITGPASAHPSSGIVVDQGGNVFIADINTGLWKIDPQGQYVRVHPEAGHWPALDAAGRFARVDFTKSDHWPRWFKRRTPDGARPALLTDGGSPLVVLPDGNLYYASSGPALNPGGHEVIRLAPDGTLRRVAGGLDTTSERLGGIKGLAAGPDGALYVSYPKAVLKLSAEGKVTTLADPVVAADCDEDLPPGAAADQLPLLRGLAADGGGAVYAAASCCRRVVKISAGGKVQTVLKAEPPWSPTGVALHGDAIYVLEYPNANGDRHADWVPRVRKVGRDGRVSTLGSFPK
jgi:sugar lactone lactonase YvrE